MNGPQISVIVPVYNMSRYLPEFLASVAAQSHPVTELELIFVDDGSTDDSATVIADWCRVAAPDARLVTKPNGGLSAARNDGLVHATGQWVTFPDPDDVLHPEYFSVVSRFLASREARSVDLACTNLLLLDDATGQIRNRHPLRFKFDGGTQIVDLERHPTFLHLQAASGFYRRDAIERLELTFDPRIVPGFEDADFTAKYLDERDHPRLACLADARYHYRRRADGTSAVQSSWSKPEKYTWVTRYGNLALARLIHDRRGHLPIWVQNLLLYDLFFYFRNDERIHSETAAVSERDAEEFHRIVEQIMTFIDTETIDAFAVMPTSLQLRRALVIGYQRKRLRPTEIPLIRIDIDPRIVQIRYFFGGELPVEEYRVRGRPIRPVYAKIRDVRYLGRTLMHERIVWLPADGTIRVSLDGHSMPLVLGGEPDPPHVLRPARLWKQLANRRPPDRLLPSPPSTPGVPPPPPATRPASPVATTSKRRQRFLRGHGLRRRARAALHPVREILRGTWLRRPVSAAGRWVRRVDRTHRRVEPPVLTDAEVRALAATPEIRERYRDAWVLMDRDEMAQDNAEHLYRHVRDHHPEVNAWFVLRSDSADWNRLQQDGFRLIAHRSTEFVLLMLNATHMISSQLDHYVVQPIDERRYGHKWRRLTFLQHGVIMNDLSRWANIKPISLFITSSQAEYDAIAGDHTPYVFTSKEARLTGLPRHDRLLRLSRSIPQDATRLLLVAPTWRRSLLGEQTVGGNARTPKEGFDNSTYARAWVGLLSSSRLHGIAGTHGLRVVFVPHPNMQGLVPDLPPAVSVRRYSEMDVQDVLAHGAMMVTDYSSVAFDMAYLVRPVVYYQFDQTDFFGGSHVCRRGEWTYDGDGFGPVCTTLDQTLDAIGRAADGVVPDEPYRQRMVEAFPYRDGGCCERVFRQITLTMVPVPYEDAYAPASDTPTGPTEPAPAPAPAPDEGRPQIIHRPLTPAVSGTNGEITSAARGPRLIILSGAGRSGTSALAGTLKLLGCHIPQPEVPGDNSNPRGHFEPQWVVDFHKTMLAEGHAHAMDSRPEALTVLSAVAAAPAHREPLRQWLSEQQLTAGDLVIKDPRILWFRQLWLEVAAELDVPTSFVTVLRHPAEVVGSRIRYYTTPSTRESAAADQVAMAAGWVNASLVNEFTSRGQDRSFVRYAALLDDWRAVVRTVSVELGLDMAIDPADPARTAVETFIDESLRRVRISWRDLDVPRWLRDLAESVWLALSGTRGELSAPGVQAELDDLRLQYDRLYGQAAAMSRDHVRTIAGAEARAAQPS